MRTGIDARHLAGSRGIARYLDAMLDALADVAPDDDRVAFAPRAVPRGTSFPGVELVRSRLPSRALFGAAAVTGRPRLDRLLGGADVLWIPAPAPVAVSPGVPYVLTVHDLSWVEHPEWFTRYERTWHRLARLEALATGAARIVAVSQSTADAIARHWPGVHPARVRVVRSGAPQPPRGRAAARPPYLLCVGALEPRKDPELVLRAYLRARRDGLDARLLFAGEGRLADRLRGDGVAVLGAVDDEELGSLYAGAIAVVSSSRLEGFGFTPLEAAGYGTPSIVAAASPVVSETLGDAVLAVADRDEAAWADALLRIARDDGLRADLAARARQAAARLSWRSAAEGLQAALTEAAA